MDLFIDLKMPQDGEKGVWETGGEEVFSTEAREAAGVEGSLHVGDCEGEVQGEDVVRHDGVVLEVSHGLRTEGWRGCDAR